MSVAHRAVSPLRTCVGCRKVKPKAELVRLVRDARGAVTVDQRGTRAGRGAYICSSCASTTWNERALRGRLTHAFRRSCDGGIDLGPAMQAMARPGRPSRERYPGR